MHFWSSRQTYGDAIYAGRDGRLWFIRASGKPGDGRVASFADIAKTAADHATTGACAGCKESGGAVQLY